MMTPAGWEGFSWAAGGFLRPYLAADGEGDEKRGRMFGGVGIYLYLCGAVCGTFAAIDGCDETREQPRTAADETQGWQPRMAADGNERGRQGWLLTRCKEGGQGWVLTICKEGQARMGAIWTMKINE